MDTDGETGEDRADPFEYFLSAMVVVDVFVVIPFFVAYPHWVRAGLPGRSEDLLFLLAYGLIGQSFLALVPALARRPVRRPVRSLCFLKAASGGLAPLAVVFWWLLG